MKVANVGGCFGVRRSVSVKLGLGMLERLNWEGAGVGTGRLVCGLA